MDEKEAAPWGEMAAGTKAVLPIELCRQADGSALQILVQAVRGAKPGPTLALLGAIHGDEYEGPAALWQCYDSLDPAEIAGTAAMIPVCNPPAFRAGQRTNPEDGEDLARTFPGSPSGTATEQIAAFLHRKVVANADFVCDFHSAGRYYRISPWVGYALVENAGILDRQRQAAKVCGYPASWGTKLLPGRTLWSAAQWNVPALYVEAPGEGRAHPEDVQRNCLVVRQLLSLLNMWDRPLQPFQADSVIEDRRENSGYLQTQIVARHGGYFAPAARLGERVEAGDRFGDILGTDGKPLQTITAPTTGDVVFLRTFPVVAPGDSLGTVRG